MAFIPCFIIGPTSLIGLIGLLHGPDLTKPTPKENWKDVTFDLIIPSFNEETNIVLCLASIQKQTLKPRRVILYDDNSSDHTIEYAKRYANYCNFKLEIVSKKKSSGKTTSIYDAILSSDADVLGILDADTLLKSKNYWERLVFELYQGVGIAAACGTVLPNMEHDRSMQFKKSHLSKFSAHNPDISFSPDNTIIQRWQRALTNAYREQLYLFLQSFIYRGEMTSLGTLIFPIGCAVLYRREYLHKVYEHFMPIFGFDFTDSEDIFFGFAFARQGYRNIQVQDVYTSTMDPRFSRLYHQIMKWSSSFLQCCFYFNSLFFTPIKTPGRWYKQWKDKHNPETQQLIEHRKIKEAYRQPFGVEYTQRYGRMIGWFIFTTALEKISFPIILLIFAILGLWKILAITMAFETLFYATLIFMLYPKHKIKNFIKAILFMPIRYSQILFDLVIVGKFVIDLWVTKNRSWRK